MNIHEVTIDELYRLYLRMDELYRAFAKLRGETYTTLWAIEELGQCPEGMTHKQIAAALCVPKQTVASAVATLERRGVVETKRSETDGRSRIVQLTPEGNALFKAQSREMHRIEHAAAARIDPAALQLTVATFGQLVDEMALEMDRSGVPIRTK